MARCDVSVYAAAETAAAATADALFELGLMCCAGRDAAPDLVSAHKWFNLAATRGNGGQAREWLALR
jgi:TPR repeat protein